MIDVDISLIFNQRDYDLSLDEGDLKLDKTLKTPILASLYTNLRVMEEGHEHLEEDPQVSLKRGGYWANSIRGEQQGSYVWIYKKARRDTQAAENLQKTCLESLSWLNKNIEIKYKLREDEIVLNYRIPGEEGDFNFNERF